MKSFIVSVSMLSAVTEAALTNAQSKSVRGHHKHHKHHHHHHHQKHKLTRGEFIDADDLKKEMEIQDEVEVQEDVKVEEEVAEEKVEEEDTAEVSEEKVEVDNVDAAAELQEHPKDDKVDYEITDEDARSAIDFEALQVTFNERCSRANHQILTDDLVMPASPKKWNGMMGIEGIIQSTGAQYLTTQTLMMFDRCSNVAGERKVVNDEGFNSCCQVLHEGCCNAAQRLSMVKNTSGVSHYWPLVCQRATGFPFGGTDGSSKNHCLEHTAERRRILYQSSASDDDFN